MIVLIAPETDIENEISILHQLFEAGLEYYHLRKPEKSIEEHREYLHKIDSVYHNRIVTHYFHELCMEFNLKGVHLQEQVRLDLGNELDEYVNKYKTLNYSVSSSFHEPEALQNCDANFDYHLLSPVFSSISKKGYVGRGFDVNHINKTIVGMGGINENTIEETIKLGFQGIGVLGGIWNVNDSLGSFLRIKQGYSLEKQ